MQCEQQGKLTVWQVVGDGNLELRQELNGGRHLPRRAKFAAGGHRAPRDLQRQCGLQQLHDGAEPRQVDVVEDTGGTTVARGPVHAHLELGHARPKGAGHDDAPGRGDKDGGREGARAVPHLDVEHEQRGHGLELHVDALLQRRLVGHARVGQRAVQLPKHVKACAGR